MVVILILGTKWLLFVPVLSFLGGLGTEMAVFVPVWCFSGGLGMEKVASVPVLRGVVSVWQPVADIGAGSQLVVLFC